MPREAINLEELIQKLKSGKILADGSFFKFQGTANQEFLIFQDSGLNVLLGKEGHGKTKFLTFFIHSFLDLLKRKDTRFINWKVLAVDTERPESQYAISINHILEKSEMLQPEVFDSLHLLSVIDLGPTEIRSAITEHLQKFPQQRFIIIIDHILPLVNDMNSTTEATEVDQFLKSLLCSGNIIIASIHKPANAMEKGLGHLGSSLQRLASYILEISINTECDGFNLKQIKSRISAVSKTLLNLKNDDCGNIDPNSIQVSDNTNEQEDKSQVAKDILIEFIESKSKSKKEILEIICLRNDWKSESSSKYKFYATYLSPWITFIGDDFQLTEDGKKVLANEKQ